mmetsp:Transcript_32515/g.71546  ORF Transcript_32515/g.71546 Transcript_32515/m.71546 type:complete len:203 (+) Transcript_32515:703-1311(+)
MVCSLVLVVSPAFSACLAKNAFMPATPVSLDSLSKASALIWACSSLFSRAFAIAASACSASLPASIASTRALARASMSTKSLRSAKLLPKCAHSHSSRVSFLFLFVSIAITSCLNSLAVLIDPLFSNICMASCSVSSPLPCTSRRLNCANMTFTASRLTSLYFHRKSSRCSSAVSICSVTFLGDEGDDMIWLVIGFEDRLHC